AAGQELRPDLIAIPQVAMDVPAQAVADDHTRRHLPLILEKESQGGLVDVTCSVAEGTRGPIQPAKEQLCEDNVHARDRNRGRRIRRRQCVVTLETEQARPGAIPQAERRSVLIVTTDFEGVGALDQGDVGRGVEGLYGEGDKRVCQDATVYTVRLTLSFT